MLSHNLGRILFLLLLPKVVLASIYTGIELGSIFIKSENEILFTSTNDIYRRNNAGLDGVNAGIVLGNSATFGIYYIASEMFAKYNCAFSSDHHVFFKRYKTKVAYNAGVRFLPGYELASNIVGYGILGYEHILVHTTIQDPFFRLNQSEAANFNGWQIGLGTEVAIAPAIHIRFINTYTFYGRKKYLQNNAFSMHSQVSNSEFSLGLIFFC